MPRPVVPMFSPSDVFFVERTIFGKVPWEDYVSAVANAEIIGKPRAAFCEFVQFLRSRGPD